MSATCRLRHKCLELFGCTSLLTKPDKPDVQRGRAKPCSCACKYSVTSNLAGLEAFKNVLREILDSAPQLGKVDCNRFYASCAARSQSEVVEVQTQTRSWHVELQGLGFRANLAPPLLQPIGHGNASYATLSLQAGTM